MKRFIVIHSSEHKRLYPEGEAAIGEWSGCWCCVDNRDGSIVGSDGGEPEDQLLTRDWRWVPAALNKLSDERDDARAKLRALADAASALCRDAAIRGELKDEMRDSWEACMAAVAAARGAL